MARADTDNSTAEPARPRPTIKDVKSGLFELETPMLRVCNLAYAVRMLASSDEMPKEPGAALDSLADTLVNELVELAAECERLYHLSHEALNSPDKGAA
jgi:hypothetical protein